MKTVINRLLPLFALTLMILHAPLYAVERLDLEGTDIVGSKDQPQVLYIVPWKESAMDHMVVKPGMRLEDQLLQPLDRDIFKRQIDFYQALGKR